jgi:acetolactate synthase-1/2/3 large subunit
LTTGLLTANSEGDPVVALGGAVATSQSSKHVHQTFQAVSAFKPLTKFSAETSSPESIAETLANAFAAAESDRPGAAFVSLPKDIMEGEASCEALTGFSRPGFGPGSRCSLEETAKIINSSERAVILLGLLASKPANADAIRAFMRITNIPAVGTFQAAGAVSADLFQNFAGRVGQLGNSPGDDLLAAADVIITIGYDPVEYDPSIWNHLRKAKLIHIDSNRADIDNFYLPAVQVMGDIAASLFALLDLVNPISLAPDVKRFFANLSSQRLLGIDDAKRAKGNPVHPTRIVAELQQWLTQDVTVCVDMGSFHLWIAHFLFSFRARQILISNGNRRWAWRCRGQSLPVLCGHMRKRYQSRGMAGFSSPEWNWKPRSA